MAPITTGSFPKALWPGIHAWWGQKYDKHPMEYPDLFDLARSDKNYEEDVEEPGFGLAPQKPEGSPIIYDSHQQGPTTRYTNVAYGKGFIVTREEQDDNLYKDVAFKRTASLAFSFRQTRENVGANVYNRAFNAGFVGGDGVSLINTAHPTLDGSQSNRLSTNADFEEGPLEDLLIQIADAKNTKGLRISLMGMKLIVPTALQFAVERVINSTLRSGTADNDTNANRSLGLLPDGACINHYLTDPDAWFIRTNVDDGLRWFDRIDTEFSEDNDFDTENMKYKGYMRFVAGWSDWRGLYGSDGSG